MQLKKHYGKLQQDVELKEQFLENMKKIDKNSDGYVLNSRSNLKKIGEYEKRLNKDVYDFSLVELNDMLYEMEFGTWGAARELTNTLKKYLIYARSKNLGNMSLDITDFFRSDLLKKYVSKNKLKGKFINEKDFKKIINTPAINNPRDKLFLWLLRLGIRGKRFNELSMLKNTDVDIEGKFITTNQKIVKNLPNEVITLIKQTINTNEYYNINKDRQGQRIEKALFLKKNNYLFRPVDRIGHVSKNMTATDFTQLFNKLKKYFEEYSYVTAMTIYTSGMLWSFRKYLQQHGYTNDDLNDTYKTNKIFEEFRQKHYPDATGSYSYDFVALYKNIMD